MRRQRQVLTPVESEIRMHLTDRQTRITKLGRLTGLEDSLRPTTVRRKLCHSLQMLLPSSAQICMKMNTMKTSLFVATTLMGGAGSQVNEMIPYHTSVRSRMHLHGICFKTR